MSERIFAISDIHIGNPLFIQEHRLVDFLEFVKAEATGLVINGDFLDIQQGPSGKIMDDFDTVLAKILELADSDLKLWYIVGNHDIQLSGLLVKSRLINIVYPYLQLDVGGYRIHFEHGHLFDRYYRKMPFLYNMGSRLLGLALRFSPHLGDDLGSIYGQLQAARHKFAITPASPEYDGNFSEYEEGAGDILSGKAGAGSKSARTVSGPIDIVSFGHTHEPMTKEISPGNYYINSGTWVDKATYLEFSEDGVFYGDWKTKKRDQLIPARANEDFESASSEKDPVQPL